MATTERAIQPLPKNEQDLPVFPLAFYCKNCEKIVPAVQSGKKFRFRCPQCKKLDIAFGTEISVKNFYHIKD